MPGNFRESASAAEAEQFGVIHNEQFANAVSAIFNPDKIGAVSSNLQYGKMLDKKDGVVSNEFSKSDAEELARRLLLLKKYFRRTENRLNGRDGSYEGKIFVLLKEDDGKVITQGYGGKTVEQQLGELYLEADNDKEVRGSFGIPYGADALKKLKDWLQKPMVLMEERK